VSRSSNTFRFTASIVTSGTVGAGSCFTRISTEAAAIGCPAVNKHRNVAATAVSLSWAAKCSKRRYSLSAVAASWDSSVS
jgi:hypothetical protein